MFTHNLIKCCSLPYNLPSGSSAQILFPFRKEKIRLWRRQLVNKINFWQKSHNSNLFFWNWKFLSIFFDFVEIFTGIFFISQVRSVFYIRWSLQFFRTPSKNCTKTETKITAAVAPKTTTKKQPFGINSVIKTVQRETEHKKRW